MSSEIHYCVGCMSGHEPTCRLKDCAGCAPPLAEEGLLCRWCFERLRRDVLSVPGLIEHLFVVAGTRVRAEGEAVSRSVPGPRCLYRGEQEAADKVFRIVAGLALEVSAGRRVAVPGQAHWWCNALGPVSYGRRDDVEILVDWLVPQLEWVAWQPWVGKVRQDLGRTLAGLRAHWPERERPRPLPTLVCEACGLRTLVYYPPAAAGVAVEVACDNPACSAAWPEEKWSKQVRALIAGWRME